MAIVKSRSSRENINLGNLNGLKAVRVIDIILDINHPLAEENGGYDSIGKIFFTDLDENDTNMASKDASSAFPLFTHLKYYPLINETVLVISTNTTNIYDGKEKDDYYLPQINMWRHPHHNALPTLKNLNHEESVTNDYRSTENGLVRRVEDGSTETKLGNYFNEQLNIKPLLSYEGDMILEGRFGNSIRFGSTNKSNEISNPNSWSDLGNTGDPITIIRNGQPDNLDDKGWLPTIENINGDASSIYLTSNQKIQNFIQASPYMDSFNAIYKEPLSLEQSLLEPSNDDLQSSNIVIENETLPNKDLDLSGTLPGTGISEKEELENVINNPKTTNESESSIDDQIIQKDNINLELPNSYVDPGSGAGSSGATDEFDLTID